MVRQAAVPPARALYAGLFQHQTPTTYSEQILSENWYVRVFRYILSRIMPSPLIPDILSLLNSYPQGISEHELLKALRTHSAFAGTVNGGELGLFQRHFIVMNGLYELQRQLWEEEGVVLTISPLCIQLVSLKVPEQVTPPELTKDIALRTYYQDWGNFDNTSQEDVIALLQAFWRRFNKCGDRSEERAKALQILNLEQSATHSDITRRYRELAAQHHPDKGGERETFIRIRQAYEILKSV